MGMFDRGIQQRQQLRNQRELMDLQTQNQMRLNEHGQKLQLDTWNKTNYSSQMDQIKKAGLNPSMIYGMKGGGGVTTGSQGGGAAAGGSAPQANPMDIAQQAQIAAQIRLLNAETDKAKAETTNVGATEESTRVNTEIASIQKEILAGTKQLQIQQIESIAEQEVQRLKQMNVETHVAEETMQNEISKSTKELFGIAIANELMKAKTNLTSAQITEIVEKLRQGQEGLDLKRLEIETRRQLEQQNIDIKEIDVIWKNINKSASTIMELVPSNWIKKLFSKKVGF